MRSKANLFLTFNCILLISCQLILPNKEINYLEGDIYVDKLAYLKHDSSLLTGAVQAFDSKRLKFEKHFCSGQPCGEWIELIKEDTLHKGVYLNINLHYDSVWTNNSSFQFVNYYTEAQSLKILAFEFICDDPFKSYKNLFGLDHLVNDLYNQLGDTVQIDVVYLALLNSVYKPDKVKYVKYYPQNGYLNRKE